MTGTYVHSIVCNAVTFILSGHAQVKKWAWPKFVRALYHDRVCVFLSGHGCVIICMCTSVHIVFNIILTFYKPLHLSKPSDGPVMEEFKVPSFTGCSHNSYMQ